MKPDKESTEDETVPPAGDVIGETAYSERFVLKILLKLANLDTLKDEVKEKSFEDDLCTLWDMTAERDVVLFLQKHNVLNLFHFALPIIDSPRIIEIIIGIIGNMCCHKEVSTALFNMEPFLTILLEYIKTDDSLILIQLLRFINSALFLADDDNISIWMSFFESLGYSEALYFILKNSSNKELLVTALENFNTVCSYLNSENTRTNFFTQFVNLEALDALTTACVEVVVNQKTLCERDEVERVSVICLQIALNLIGFDKSVEIYEDCKHSITTMINNIILYYEDKLINQKEMDPGLLDIIDCVNTIVSTFNLSKTSEPEAYFMPSYCMWKAIVAARKTQKNGNATAEFEDEGDQGQFLEEIKSPLCTLLAEYMLNCNDNILLTILDATRHDYEDIVCGVESKEMQSSVSRRTASYRTRLKENTDS